MEELKLLVQMVASLPTLAVWVIVAFYVYKISIIGSIYGCIRFGMNKLHDWAITRKTVAPITQEINFEDKLHGICISSDSTINMLMQQIQRLKGIGGFSRAMFIHLDDVNWLRDAINEKLEKEKEAKE